MASVSSCTSGFPQEVRAGHLVAAADGLTARVVQSAQHLSVTDLPITCCSGGYLPGVQGLGTYPPFTVQAAPGELLSPRGRGRGAFPSPPLRPTTSPVTYRWALLRRSRRRRETFTGRHHQPLCPGDTAKHPWCAAQVTVYPVLRRHFVPSVLRPNPELGIHKRPKRAPPGLYLPGPSVAFCHPRTLAAYPTFR
uniref:Uncharacterized protein n=1 Tax=Candidatus Kentrum sp. LFY TaxID=2126342 RepID=A0A450WJQ7_9GAMM|nr:MAG: hypothetical protein BECKLFY1418C_GA0070996_10304 [Candidatus Kentron sp. LFY]